MTRIIYLNVEYIHHTEQGKSKCLHTGMPMGYGTIASNGAAHGSKAQTIYNYKPKIYMQIQGKHNFTHGHKPLKHLIET